MGEHTHANKPLAAVILLALISAGFVLSLKAECLSDVPIAFTGAEGAGALAEVVCAMFQSDHCKQKVRKLSIQMSLNPQTTQTQTFHSST